MNFVNSIFSKVSGKENYRYNNICEQPLCNYCLKTRSLKKVIRGAFLFSLVVFNINAALAQCEFSISPVSPCSGTAVVFNTISSESGFAWDFDNDGNFDAFGNTVSYTFPTSITDESYIITLFQDSVVCNTDTLLVAGLPDASIGVVPGSGTMNGNEIRVCSGAAQATLSIFNTSMTFPSNQSYLINWGDGNFENYNNATFSNSNAISHMYNGFGYYYLELTVIGINGCERQEEFVFYNGSNPSVGLANPGNTVGLCIPATITFPITNTENNPAGTVYFIYISGEEVASYNQNTIPSEFTYTFTETSCGISTSTGNYQNAFDVQIQAINPCASSQATIEPIELSAPPIPSLNISEPFPCVDHSTFFTNVSETFEVQNGNCSSNLAASWIITPGESGVDWNILSGNLFSANELELEFLIEGDYTVTMVINSEDCGSVTITETITVVGGGEANAGIELSSGNGDPNDSGCLPSIVAFNNLSTGADLNWYWFVSPIEGYEFIDSTSFLSTNPIIQFNESGNYEVTLFATNACGTVTWDTLITVSDNPEIHLLGLDEYCEEATLNFSGSDIYFIDNESEITSYFWHFPGAIPDTSSEKRPQGIYYDSPGTYIITVEATNNCGTSSLTDTLNILQPGALELSSDTSTCIDGSGFLLNANPNGGEWSGSGVSSGGWFDPSMAVIGANELTYNYLNNACPVTGNMTVIVEDLPQVDAGTNQNICENGQAFFINGGYPANGIWTSDNGGVIISNSVFDPQASGPGIYNLTYTFTDFNNCENSDEKIIIVNALPLVEAGPDRTICENPNDILLTGNFPAGGIWSGPGVSPNGVFNVSNTPGPGVYELQYTITDANTGCSNTDFLTVTIIDNPIANAGADQIVCIDEGLINLSGGTPAGGTWSGTGVTSAAGVFNPLEAGTGLHVLTYSFGSGICQTTDQRVIYVEPLPVISVPPDNDFCENAVPFNLNTAFPAGGIWSGNGINGNNFDPQLAGIGQHTLSYNYINPLTGCANSKSTVMTVHAIPLVYAGDSIYCDSPGIVGLPLANPPGGSWSGLGITNGTFDPQLAGGEGFYNLTYTYTNNYNCSNSAAALITVIAPAMAEAGPNDTLCIDHGDYQLEDFSPISGIWSGVGIIDSINGIFDPQLAGGGNHVLTLSTGNGNCQVIDTRIIRVIDLTDAALGEGISMCISEAPIFINVNGPPGGFWTGAGITDATAGLFDPGLAGGGIHTLTYTYVNSTIGCNAFIVKDITVHDMEQPEIEISNIACINESILFTQSTSPDHTLLWNFGDGETSSEFEPIHIYQETGNYTITLIAENQYGCVDSTSHDLLLTQLPIPLFDLSTENGCAPLIVDINNQSIGYDVDFYWDFGNGSSSNTINPDPVIFNQGINDTTYYITLATENICGTRYYQDSVLVFPQPLADFGIAPESSCTPVVANFANVTTGSATSFYWDFGNGNTSTDSIPSAQTYFADTTTLYYLVSLTASNSCGSNTITKEVVVEPADVQSFFNVSTTQGCQPLIVNFSDYSTPGANVDWLFGDGNTSTLDNPVHTFTDPGNYTVIQYASSTCGYDSTTVNITVYPIPEVAFVQPEKVCKGEEVHFLNQSIGTTGHFWEFGDGNTSNLNNPVHVYESPGVYTVTLTGVSAFNQCPNIFQNEIVVLAAPTAGFQISQHQGCVPLSVELTNTSTGGTFFEWHFGDGNSSVSENPEHTYFTAGNYPISLVVIDANGCFKDTIASNIIIHPNPQIDFEFEKLSSCGLPTEVLFQNNTQGASGFLWDFGDGNQSFLYSPVHSFFNEGDFRVQLTVSTPFGCIDSLQQEIGIYPQPISDFYIETNQGCSPLQVFFNNESTHANHYYWTFGDGNYSEARSPLHQYDSAGIYDVQLIVSNDQVCFDTLLFEDAVRVLQNPFASFETIENQDGSFQFVNHSDYAHQYFWDFNDGYTSDKTNPEHRFLTNGIKQVRLEATSNNGCIDDTLVTITPGFLKALYIPNGFSPEQGIGEVRLFQPKGVGLKEYHVQIFSTYGQLIWESRELEGGQPTESWDGTYGGTLLPQDVYVWKAAAIFEDGSAWRGVDDGKGGFKTMGSVILLR